MSNPVEDFEFVLKKHCSKRHLVLYHDKKQHNKHTYRPQDVISSVSDQLKAIQVADDAKNNKTISRDLHKLKRSTFLSVNNLPVYEEAPKPANTFDTQFVSNTQLINIIEDAEIKDKHRGMTQEFETSFSHTDKLGLGGSIAVPPDKDNTNNPHKKIERVNLIDKTQINGSKDQNIEDNVTKDFKYGNYCSNNYIKNDNDTNKTHAEDKYKENKYVIEKSDAPTPETSKNNDNKYSVFDETPNKTCSASLRLARNKDIVEGTHTNKYKEQHFHSEVTETDDITDKTYIMDERIPENKVIVEETEKNCYKNRNLNNNIAENSEIYTERDITHANPVDNETDNFKDDDIEQDINELNQCIELELNTENYTEIPSSPVFVCKKVKNKSASQSPLVFDLDKFESFAISMLEHSDFEKAKHVINSQILGKELHVKADEDIELQQNDVLSPVLRIKTNLYNIQNAPHKKFKEEDSKHISNHCNKEETTEPQLKRKERNTDDNIPNFTNKNNNSDNPNDPLLSVIENQSPILSQILPDNVKKKAPNKHNTINSNNLDKHVNPKDPKLDQSNISILNDEILFSSDEEDIHKENQDLPFTCALETSFYNQSDVLDKTMYVGFQTASNRSIQICKNSFDKARSLLNGVDDDATTVTELVKICDNSNRDIDDTEVKKVEIFSETVDEVGQEMNNIFTKENSMNICVNNVRNYSSNHKSDVEDNNNFDGFKTASNKIISLSEKALVRCKKVFQDIDLDEKCDAQTKIDTKGTLIQDNFEDKKLNYVNMEITEGDFIKTNFEKPNTADVSMKDECLDDLIHNINDEIIIQEFENIEMSLEEDKDIKDGGFVGFKTASVKNIVISDQVLAMTKNIFKDIDNDDGIDENKIKRDHNYINTDCGNPKTIGFKVASTKQTHISGDFHETENILQDIDYKTNKYEPQEININLMLDRNNDDHSSANSFIGFKTANNKAIKISKEALAKTDNIFKDIDSVRFREKSNSDKGRNDKNKDMYPNIEDFDQPSTSKATFAGFKTGNNKEIKISKASLAKVKDVFKDINLNEEDHPVKTDFNETLASKSAFSGLKMGKHQENEVCKSLDKIKGVDTSNIEPYTKRDLIEDSNIDELNKPSTSKATFGGFKTANNREIKISEAALSRTRNIFNNIDSIDMPRKPDNIISNERMSAERLQSTDTNKTSFLGFKTGNNKEINISDAALAKTRRIFSDVDAIGKEDVHMNECTDKPEDNNLSTGQNMLTLNNNMTEEFTFQGFKTASNKQVKVSKEALSKTKNIFKDIDTDDNFNIEAEKLHINSKNIRSSSFGTATDKFVHEPKDNILEKGSTFKGFQTASNKLVTISEEALARSKNIFKDLNTIENVTNPVLREDSNELKIANSYKPHEFDYKDNEAEFKGFQTCNNKVINVSERALIDSKKILQNTSSFKGFNTASDKKVSISEEALEKCRKVFRDMDVDEKDGNVNKVMNKKIDFGFKSANNKTIKVSENAIAESKKIFEGEEAIKNVEKVHIAEDICNIIDTQVINNFEETLYTEDFKATPTKSKRSGSPILSCPRAKKRKKFATPYSQKPVKNIVKDNITVKTANIIKFDDNYKKNKQLTLKDLQKFADGNAKIDPYITKFTYDNLLQFEFTGRRNDLSSNNITISSLKELFLNSVNFKLVPEGWMENHIKQIIWKLISYEIRFPEANIICSITNVLNQLKYRYDRELFNAERPTLRKIFERDDLSTKTIVLCVVQIYENGVQVNSVTNLTSNIELLLTDGWYCIKATTDRMLAKLVYDQKIVIGAKIVTHGAELMNCEQGMAPWEDTSSVRLKLFGNSTRRARWDARLGYHGNAAILTHLSAVNTDGGRVSKLRVFVTRVYPSLYVEKFEDGSTVTRSERLENIHQMKYETERQIIMEKLYEEVEKEFSDQESQDSEGYSDSGGKRTCLDSGTQIAKMMRKSNDPAEFRPQLTSSQSILLAHHTEKRREKLLQDVQVRIREKMEKGCMCVTRNVVPVKKIRVVEVEERGGAVEVTKGMMSIWKPNEAILEIFEEGVWIDVLNVIPTAVRYSEIQLSAGRQSVFSQSKYIGPDQFKPYTTLLKRKCFNIKDIAQNPSMPTDYNEIDTVGLVFLIDPSIREFESTKQLFQNVYITDGDKNIICVNFWGGLKKFGFENVLDTGQIVVCGNLQKRAGNTRKNIPQYRVTEFSYFTKTPKNENARIILEELNKIFLSLDRRKFCEDCIILKNNYSVIKHCNTENISPYRPNNSDLNMSKNKQFINTPLSIKDNFNLTGLDFESTFKQTDTQDLSNELLLRKKRVDEKITKLKMYGEPPPLSPITILNKSKNAFNSYKSPLLSESRGSNATRIPNPNFDSFLNVASVINTPQKKVVLNDSERSPVLDRTYVKSVNPVKLNFNENNDSVIDHFAEEFDASPPLSLD